MARLLREFNEGELVRWLFASQTLIFTSFEFMFHEACGFQLADWELEFWFQLPREALGLPTGEKPGDIDVFIIPSLKGDRFAERSMAIEVKKLFASKRNRKRSPNAFGTAQIQGLFKSGFPFIGLLHLVLIEASDTQHLIRIPVVRGVNRKGDYVYGESIETDPAAFWISERHHGRMRRVNLPYFSGYKVQALQLSERGERFVGMNANDSRAPMRNPEVSETLLAAIRKLRTEPDCTIRFTYGGTEINHKLYLPEEDNLTPLIEDEVDAITG